MPYSIEDLKSHWHMCHGLGLRDRDKIWELFKPHLKETLEPAQQSPPEDKWTCTCNLRILRETSPKTDVLQQQYVNGDKHEWRNIPIVFSFDVEEGFGKG